MDHQTGSGAGQTDGSSMPDDEASAQPAAPPTGDRRVDEALAPLAWLAGRPVAEHPPVFERLHGQLVEVLGELGPAAGQAGPPG
ncbi:MAG: hypothetical protein ACR2FU_04905 [Streptosporangiaceae bacterium]